MSLKALQKIIGKEQFKKQGNEEICSCTHVAGDLPDKLCSKPRIAIQLFQGRKRGGKRTRTTAADEIRTPVHGRRGQK